MEVFYTRDAERALEIAAAEALGFTLLHDDFLAGGVKRLTFEVAARVSPSAVDPAEQSRLISALLTEYPS
jgi:hypothetical protein